MSYTDVRDWAGDVRLQCPGVMLPVAIDALKKATRAFLRDSEVWVEVLTPIDIVATYQSYAVTAPTDRIMLRLIRASQEGYIDQIPLDLSLIQYDPSLGTVKLYRTPSSDLTDGLVLEVALGNTDNAYDLPAWIADRWGDALRSGARSLLFQQAGKPWSNLQAAQIEAASYQEAVRDAMMSRVSHNSAAPMTMSIVQVL